MTHKLTWMIPLQIQGLKTEDGSDLTAEMAAAELERMAAELRRDPSLLPYVVTDDAPDAEEDGWVLRKIGSPGVIHDRDAGWTELPRGDVMNPSNALHPDTAAIYQHHTDILKSGFWSRSGDIWRDELLVEMHDDLHVIEVHADIHDWLRTTSVENLRALVEDDWAFGYGADQILYDLEAARDPAALRLTNYLAQGPRTPGGDDVGFAVEVMDPVAARAFLVTTRDDLPEDLFDDDSPEP